MRVHLHLGDLSALVVSSENCEPISVANLQRDKQSDCFNRIVTSVNVVSHEEVVCVWGLATNLEELFQIVELAVDIPTNCDGCTYL
jgi:hypothetical protein